MFTKCLCIDLGDYSECAAILENALETDALGDCSVSRPPSVSYDNSIDHQMQYGDDTTKDLPVAEVIPEHSDQSQVKQSNPATSSRVESSQSVSSVSISSVSGVSTDVSSISYTDLASVVGDMVKKQLQDIKDNQVGFTLFSVNTVLN